MMALRNSVNKVAPLCNIIRNYRAGTKLVDVAVNEKTGFATVTMQRLPVNSLNMELLTELGNTIDDLENNKTRGMILTSASSTVFSAGLDIMEMYKPDADRVRSFWSSLQDCWLKLYGCSFPSAAAINGHSPAGGCLLAMSCEYRAMVNKFTIGLNETQLGIVPPSWFIDTMLNTISARETEAALTAGKLFSTEEAFKIGMVDDIADDKADAVAKCEKFLMKFAKIHPLPRQLTKTAIRKNALADLMDKKEEDIQNFLFFVNQPKVQKSLEMYIEALKKKSK